MELWPQLGLDNVLVYLDFIIVLLQKLGELVRNFVEMPTDRCQNVDKGFGWVQLLLKHFFAANFYVELFVDLKELVLELRNIFIELAFLLHSDGQAFHRFSGDVGNI